ncbi:MAG: hypothetical protein KDD40_11575, partial [Bdellovibrionales bacterium]|nr:hypothetical protein [Bdellovibrionales bacterium]
KAYAKPFGGRMGPWYGREWAPGDPKSSGPKVDTRGQPRTEAGGLLASQADTDRFPNYSRFPGDELGLSSRLAQASLKHLNVNFQGNVRHYFDSYLVIRPGNTNDPLAWDTKTQTPPASRTFEIAAIIPDLFDIAYYSIDANYWGNYGAKINANKGALGIADDVVIRPDLGYHAGIPDLENYNVRRQIEVARASGLQIPEAFYYVKSFQHLLTGWVPGPLANNYTTAADPKVPFGKCEQADFSSDPNNPAPPNPGACIVGGRTGYSVKLVSGNYLKSNNFLIGSGNTKGPILNPPPF